jgi:hypothetical protein
MAGRQRGELAGVLRSGGVLRRGSEGNAKEREEWISGAFVVLMRVLGEDGGLCSGRSTAALRWRPRGRFWARRGAWHGREGSSARQQAGEEEQRDAWAPARSKGVAGKALHGAGGRRYRSAVEKQRKGIRSDLKFPKLPGTTL